MPHKCKNGHIHNIDFGEEVRVKCPTADCAAMVSRTADFIAAEPVQPVEQVPVKQGFSVEDAVKWAIAHKVQFGGGAVVVLMAVLFFEFYPSQPSNKNIENVIPKVGTEQTQAVNESAPKRNVITEVSIADFKTTALAGLNLRFTFNLVNSGQNNDYPTLVITWRGIDAKPIEILENAYPHPSTPFTTVPVEFEIARPANATGVDVSVKY